MSGRPAVRPLVIGCSDIGAAQLELERMVLATPSGTATLAGQYVDILGQRVGGLSYSGTVTTTPQTLAQILGGLPQNAVGLAGRLSADIILGRMSETETNPTPPSALATDMAANPARYPLLASSTNFKLGRVS